MEDLELKAGLPMGDDWKVGEIQLPLDAQIKNLNLTKREMEVKEDYMKETDHDCERLQLELNSVWTAISRRERVMRDFTERVCMRYTSVARAQATRYRHCVKDVLGDAQSLGEYWGGYLICLVEYGHALNVDGDDSYQECKGSTPLPCEVDDIVEVSPPARSLWLIVYLPCCSRLITLICP